MVIYKSTLWASCDKDAPDFETYLGDAKLHLDMTLDCRDGRSGGSEVIGVHRWKFPANWKFAAENFLGDSYHNHSHGSVDAIGIGPSSRSGVKGRRDVRVRPERGRERPRATAVEAAGAGARVTPAAAAAGARTIAAGARLAGAIAAGARTAGAGAYGRSTFGRASSRTTAVASSAGARTRAGRVCTAGAGARAAAPAAAVHL